MLNPAPGIEDHASTVSLVAALADYAATPATLGDNILGTARHSLIDALGRAFEALRDPECAALIGPLVPGALMPGGARVPGTSLELDPVQAAYCNALLLCWSAGGDRDSSTGRAAPSFGAILAIADYQARKATMEGKSPPKVRDVLAAMAKALRIQGTLALQVGSQQTGTATLRLARVATTAVVTAQLGGTQGQIATALSYACVDGGISIDADERDGIGRRDWATADAVSRAVRHACQAMAAGQSSYLTPAQLKAMDAAGRALGAGRVLGAKPTTAKQHLAAVAIERLAGLYSPQQVAELTTRFQAAVARYFPTRQAERIKALFAAPERLDDLPVNELLAALVTNGSR